jgi:hypothetical protein
MFESRALSSPAIAGLDPAIHQLRKKLLAKQMDPRVKPAGDTGVCGAAKLYKGALP